MGYYILSKTLPIDSICSSRIFDLKYKEVHLSLSLIVKIDTQITQQFKPPTINSTGCFVSGQTCFFLYVRQFLHNFLLSVSWSRMAYDSNFLYPIIRFVIADVQIMKTKLKSLLCYTSSLTKIKSAEATILNDGCFM